MATQRFGGTLNLNVHFHVDRLVALVSPPSANAVLCGGILGANARLRRQAVTDRPHAGGQLSPTSGCFRASHGVSLG